jgi:hypothetical protein
MTGMVTFVATTCLLVLWSYGIGLAEVAIVRHSDGMAGTITHLGDDAGIYSGSYGNNGPILNPGGPSSFSGGPHRDITSSAGTAFGTPAPPNNLTPAPVLPMNPNRPLLPQQPTPLSSSSPPSGFSSPGGSGRVGR